MIEGEITPARFRALRQTAGVTLAEAGRQMGVSEAAVCAYETTGRQAIAEWRLYRCADWLAEKAREAA